jgi:hypothetical protein
MVVVSSWIRFRIQNLDLQPSVHTARRGTAKKTAEDRVNRAYRHD